MVELPHVTRPGVLFQHPRGLGLEAGDRLAITRRVTIEEVGSQRVNVLAALAERRQPDFDGIESEEQILAKPSRRYLRREIGVRRR